MLEFVNGLGIDDEFVACEDPEVVGEGEGYGLVQVLEEEDHGLKTSSLDACGFLPKVSRRGRWSSGREYSSPGFLGVIIEDMVLQFIMVLSKIFAQVARYKGLFNMFLISMTLELILVYGFIRA